MATLKSQNAGAGKPEPTAIDAAAKEAAGLAEVTKEAAPSGMGAAEAAVGAAASETAQSVADEVSEGGAPVDEVAAAAEPAAEEIASQADVAIDAIVLRQQEALETIEAGGQAMMDGMTRMQREIVDFVSERIRHDMSIQQELMRCRNFDEVRAVQTRFLQTAMDQYSAEATKLMRIGQELLQRSMHGRH